MENSCSRKNGKELEKTLEAIRKRRQVKKDLEKRSRDLRLQADKLYATDKAKARVFECRAVALADEARRISTENKHEMSADEIIRSNAKARIVLASDGVRK